MVEPSRLAVFLLHLTVSLLNTELAKSPNFWPLNVCGLDGAGVPY
jgi:hypothetical protein